MYYIHTKCHTPSVNASLFITTRLKDKYTFRTATHILQEITLTKLNILWRSIATQNIRVLQ